MELTAEQRAILATALALSISEFESILDNTILDDDRRDIEQCLDELRVSLDIIEKGK